MLKQVLSVILLNLGVCMIATGLQPDHSILWNAGGGLCLGAFHGLIWRG